MCTFNGAGAIIYDSINNKILVVKGRDKFSLPKGHINNNELIQSCAIREIKEETGLSIVIPKDSKTMIVKDYLYYLIKIDYASELPIIPQNTMEILFIKWLEISTITLLISECNQGLRYTIKNWETINQMF